MVWERLLPVWVPFVLLALLVAVAGQWGLFIRLPVWAHVVVLAAGLMVAVIAALRAALRFRWPDFVDIHRRVAVDNGLKYQRILAMRHETDQPRLRIGKAKAGVAEADPFALRYVALVAAMLGFLVLGPVPVSRIAAAFCPLYQPASFADMSLAGT